MRAAVVVSLFSLTLVASASLAQDDKAPAPAAPQAPAAPEAPADPIAQGDAAMSKRTLKGYEAALKAYDEALKQKPNDPKVKIRVVDALQTADGNGVACPVN